jgi:hypothetical protein
MSLLREQVTDPWIRYLLSGENPDKTFFYILEKWNATSSNKIEALARIIKDHPEILGDIPESILKNTPEESIFYAFKRLVEHLKLRGEVLHYDELTWVRKFVKSVDFRKQIERVIYTKLLENNFWDECRKKFDWELSDLTRINVAVSVLKNPAIGPARKMQIASEFNLPSLTYVAERFKELLCQNQLAAAKELGKQIRDTNIDELVIEAITSKINLNSGEIDIDSAVKIAEKFLPNQDDIISDLYNIGDKIESAFKNAS